MHIKKTISIVAAILLITSCSSTKEDEKVPQANVLYNEAMTALMEEDYKLANEKFETIEREYPATVYATEAEIRRAYTLYLDEKYAEAIAVIDDFTSQYPAYKSVPYMYYLKGMCYYEQIVDVGRDQTLSQEAREAFTEVIERFPDTPYARDAKLKRDYAANSLAGKEMNVGLFYLKKNNYIAASNRFKEVVDNYQNSLFIEEALYRLVEVYYKLGDINQAQRYASVLGYNYPESTWYKDAYNLLQQGKVHNESFKESIKRIW